MERNLLRWPILLGALLALSACQRDAAPDDTGGRCGDGLRGQGEACDGGDLAGESCASAGFEGGTLVCADDCRYDVSGCTGQGPVCGNGLREGLEECDGEALEGASCATLGYGGGELGCTDSCGYETAGCDAQPPEVACGDGTRNGDEQCDGADVGGTTCAHLGFAAGELACTTSCTLVVNGCSGEPSPHDLAGASGCEGVYAPDQVLEYHLSGDWNRVLAQPGDGSSEEKFPFEFACGEGEPILVGVSRKRGGGSSKIGFKVDVNEYVAGQTHYGLAKLVFDNSIGCCESTDMAVGDIVREHLAWRLMALSGAVASRAVFASVLVNGEPLGVMLNVEAVDKRFLLDRFGDNSGWLYKHSGGDGDGLKTNETCAETSCPNEYRDYFCFWPVSGQGCAEPPADFATSLPEHLMLDQMLRVGAVNAIVANTDGPILKDNNYYVYDWPGKRAYLPWDLDTCMKETSYDLFAGGDSAFSRVLFPSWEGDYDALLTELLGGALSLDGIQTEVDRGLRVAAAAIDTDPYADEAAADAFEGLSRWWEARHPELVRQVEAH